MGLERVQNVRWSISVRIILITCHFVDCLESYVSHLHVDIWLCFVNDYGMSSFFISERLSIVLFSTHDIVYIGVCMYMCVWWDGFCVMPEMDHAWCMMPQMPAMDSDRLYDIWDEFKWNVCVMPEMYYVCNAWNVLCVMPQMYCVCDALDGFCVWCLRSILCVVPQMDYAYDT